MGKKEMAEYQREVKKRQKDIRDFDKQQRAEMKKVKKLWKQMVSYPCDLKSVLFFC